VTVTAANETDIEDLIDAIGSHSVADPELEITVLQDLLRTIWALLSERQRTDLVQSEEAQGILNPDANEEEPDGD